MDASKAPTTIRDVVDYIIGRHADEDGSLSILKLQKLLYYVQAWHLAFGRGPLFAGKFQAWVHGPVNREVYDRFKGTHSLFSTVSRADMTEGFNISLLPTAARDHIDEILEAYGEFSGNQLENMTHEERPWIEARGSLSPFDRCEKEIKEELMTSFYASLLQEDSKATQ
ncbi:putative phage-associated protein [Methylovorus glucosotrophus]|uniref:Panacea domain-containing protein n=1 Tax=Methylovorus glucosotrophus TaxID=266009 RepID=UPI001331C176|nr:type II toxin-antitoxin system antitoxin SocA domain-containing protein [Methylovorus glucosotrophus]KAF0843426.1 putative phage-associated protein [Methylovorus glucosotrophus]